jgi:hypothetical protein
MLFRDVAVVGGSALCDVACLPRPGGRDAVRRVGGGGEPRRASEQEDEGSTLFFSDAAGASTKDGRR